jgi:heptaprenyl diphosphate synthase
VKLRLIATQEDRQIAHLAALAIGLAVAEAAIPSPLPGVKPGLANIVTLVVLARFGWRVAAWVSLLRVIAGSILLGTFLSPTFVLSLSGATGSLIVLGLTQYLSPRLFGPVTHSVAAAFAHITGQLAVVYLWLIPHAGLAYLLPIFAGAALVFGIVNGLVASSLLNRTATPASADSTPA